MRKQIINSLLLAFALLVSGFQDTGFKEAQLKNSRVRAAYSKKWPALKDRLESKSISSSHFDLYLRAFKEENILEAWVKNKADKRYTLLASYPICASSGQPGPKRRQGDGQVPEGFYEISAFQPNSSYHLALKVGYPNKSDRMKATAKDPGGDIMIHGNCVTIGCIPIQDEPIEELYVLAVEAKSRSCNIKADIFPFRFTEKNNPRILQSSSADVTELWGKLKVAYEHFEGSQLLPKISTDSKGNYLVDTRG